jgi:hypothetical protein
LQNNANNEGHTDLYTIENALINGFPEKSVQQFVDDVGCGVPTSQALKTFIRTETLTQLDTSVIIYLIRRAYPDIDIAAISGRIHDSGYPFGDEKDLSDSEFDRIVKEAFESPSEW